MPLVLYTLWRILLLVAALVAGYLVGLRGWLLVLIALLVAFAVSYLALRCPRDAAAVYLAERSARRKAGVRPRDADAEFEDAVADQDESGSTTSEPEPGRPSEREA